MENSEEIIRRYLLGQLADSDKEALEHDYFVKPGVLRQVEAGEDELIDDYLEKRLSQDDRQGFEQVFLTTKEREEKLRLAKALGERVWKSAGLQARMSRRLNVPAILFSPVGLALIAIPLVLIAGLGWLLTRQIGQVRSLQAERITWAEQESELQARLDRADAEKTRIDGRLTQGEDVKTELEAQVQRLRNLVSTLQGASRGISLALPRGVPPPGGDTPQISLPASAPLLELQLELAVEAAGYESYQAQLIRVEGGSQPVQNSLLRRRNGEPELIRFPVPSDSLSAGDYLIRLARIMQEI